jgi:hypothetical protein
MHRPPVAEQHLVGNAAITIDAVDKIPKILRSTAKIEGFSGTPVGRIPRIEIDLENRVAVRHQAVCQAGKKWGTDALKKKKAPLAHRL